MSDGTNLALAQAVVPPRFPRSLRIGLFFGLGVLAASLLAAFFLPQGHSLTVVGDTTQILLISTTAVFAFQNFVRSRSRTRIFWFLIFAGSLIWTVSTLIWSTYEIVFARPVPDLPIVDILLFVKVVPLAAAVAIAPDRDQDSHFRAFGLLDVFILMIYALYLYTFTVFAYRLLPGASETYNVHFNLADAVGNLVFIVITGSAMLRSGGEWRGLYRLYFFAAACYGLASNLINVAIDMGRYYTGSLYDIPLIAALVAFLCVVLSGRDREGHPAGVTVSSDSNAASNATPLASSHLAMLVALSTPLIGIWLLSSASAPLELRPFRIAITLLTIFLLTLLLSIKQDILTAGLFGSLEGLSETYRSIERFKTHLTQSEKLATLGELVAQVANQIKACMAAILESSSRLTSRPDTEPRILNMAGKIGQYALRTDVLVDNMLQFAQETPLRLAPLDVRPLIESALHLSRIAKLPNVRTDLNQETNCPPVRGDSSQLLHVFLQLISNAIDALEEAGGGEFDISIRTSGSQLLLEFADSGPGIKEPQRVFEPFYTTKPVGKGTGLGLSTCYGIIQQHDGEISCRNRLEGGALFAILLPLAVEALSEKRKEAGALHAEGVR